MWLYFKNHSLLIYLGDDNEDRLNIYTRDNLDKINVVCESFLTLKQTQYISREPEKLSIEPIYANSTLYFDSSFANTGTHIKIDTKNVQKIKVYSEVFDFDLLNKVISCGDNSCSENDIDFEVGIPPEFVQITDSENKNDKDDNDDDDKNNGGDDKNGLSGGAIAGIVIAVVVVVAAVIVGIIIFMKKRKNDVSSNEAKDI